MKKLISLIMVLVTCVSFVACKAPAPAANDVAPEAAANAPVAAATASNLNIPSDLPRFKILVREMNFTNTLYAGWKTALESVQDQFNVEFVFVETGGSTDTSKQALESALQTGINGSLDLGLTEQDLQIMLPAKCSSMMYSSEPTDATTATTMAGYENFIGSVDEDNYGSGLKAAEALYQAGCKNIAVAGVTKGLAKLMDERLRGFLDGVATHPDMKIIAEDYSMVEFAKAISTFAAAYPEMDGVYVSLINESVFQAFTTEGLVGRVKLAGWDVSESTKDYIENGTLVYTGAGQEGSILVAFAVLYNYLYDGTYIIPDRAVTVPRAYIDILTAQDYDNYMTYIVNSPAYTPDEVAGMIKAFNPSFTYEQFVELNKNYSLDDIMQRHGGK